MSKINSGEEFIEIYQNFLQKNPLQNVGFGFSFGSIDFLKGKYSDVDIYANAKKGVHPVDFYKEYHIFLGELKKLIETNYDSTIVAFPSVKYKVEAATLSNRKQTDIFLHNLCFINLADMFGAKSITNKVMAQPNLELLQGDRSDMANITNEEFIHYFYQFLNKDTSLANYSNKINSAKIIEQINYNKKNLFGEKPMKHKILNNEDANKLMYEGLDMIKEYFPLDKIVA